MLVHGWVCSFQPGWERPAIARFYERLAGMGRLILFDKRGTGLSDRVAGIASLEERMDDMRAVLDAVGSERAAVLGVSEGGPMSALFAATYPARTAGLVVMGSFARRSPAPDYAIDVPQREFAPEDWGLPVARRFVEERAPSLSADEDAIGWYASYLVRGGSPGAALHIQRMNLEIDVRHVLPTIQAPALVLYRGEEYLRDATRYMGDHMPGARVVALPGADHLPWEGDQEDVLREVEAFLATVEDGAEPDRVLATVLHLRVPEERAAVLGGTSAASAGRRSRLVAGRCVRPSTVPHGRSGARRRWSTMRPRCTSRRRRGSIPGSARPAANICTACRSSWPAAWPRSRHPARSSSPRPSAISWPAPAWGSASAGASRLPVRDAPPEWRLYVALSGSITPRLPAA